MEVVQKVQWRLRRYFPDERVVEAAHVDWEADDICHVQDYVGHAFIDKLRHLQEV